jgi:hypothetical protein
MSVLKLNYSSSLLQLRRFFKIEMHFLVSRIVVVFCGVHLMFVN